MDIGRIDQVAAPQVAAPQAQDSAAAKSREAPQEPVQSSPAPQKDRVDISAQAAEKAGKKGEVGGVMTPQKPESTTYDYEMSKTKDFVVKVVNRENRSEVVRQYPSEAQLALKEAYEKFVGSDGE